ncbi:MAG: hypothetical protein KDA87_08995 [Planctomycetales bacterium]|nr:hypothetical protein [Planctomycetales bacterium]
MIRQLRPPLANGTRMVVETTGGVEHKAGWLAWCRRWSLRHRTMVVLLVAYAAAVLAPRFGATLRRDWLANHSEVLTASPVQILLAFLLLQLGLSVDLRNAEPMRNLRRSAMLFFAVRTCAAILFALFAIVYDHELVRMIFWTLAIMMLVPAAGSSSGWCIHMQANARTSLVIILLSTVGSAVLMPLLIPVMALGADAEMASLLHQWNSAYSCSFLVPWVLAPIAVGIAVRQWSPERAVRLKHALRPWSLTALGLLNYANGAVGLPRLVLAQDWLAGLLILGICLATAAVLYMAAACQGRRMGLTTAETQAVTVTTSMLNTGLVLLLLASMAPDAIYMQLTVIAYTFAQHILVATMAHRREAAVSRVE